jgi:diguanylate cyclase (GGDEF)-like protein
MNADPIAELPKPAKSLGKVLVQSEHVRALVEEFAKELSLVNRALEQEIASRDSLPGVKSALKKNEAVAKKVKETTQDLTDVIQALEGEVRNRDMLDHQFAAITEQEEAARHAAIHDFLTGLPNRVLFNDRLEQGLAQAKRQGWTVAVMFIDLDKFKNINDSYGHDAGDEVLRTIARRLKENTRGDDTVSRHSGDEFLYLLMGIRGEQNIALVAEKIIKAIQWPCNVNVRDISISLRIQASVGISIFPKNGTTAETLIKSADSAMYQAKQNKSGYSFAR